LFLSTWNTIRIKLLVKETIADAAVIPAIEDGLFSTENLKYSRKKNTKIEVLKLRQLLPCSNVTIRTPYQQV
jgi:hypothetical protein